MTCPMERRLIAMERQIITNTRRLNAFREEIINLKQQIAALEARYEQREQAQAETNHRPGGGRQLASCLRFNLAGATDEEWQRLHDQAWEEAIKKGGW